MSKGSPQSSAGSKICGAQPGCPLRSNRDHLAAICLRAVRAQRMEGGPDEAEQRARDRKQMDCGYDGAASGEEGF